MTTIRMLLAAPLALMLALTAPAMAEERTVPQSRTQMQLSFAPLVIATADEISRLSGYVPR